MRRLRRFWLLTAVPLAWAASSCPCVAAAAVFKLKGGGEVRGELTNPDESPRNQYAIRPYTGGELTLDASLVSEVVSQRPVEVEYEKARLTFGETVDDQWKLAEWCREHRLNTERKAHLEKIIALEPDHAEARRLLGYEKVGDRWLTRTQIMQEQGRVKYRGRWRLPQDVEVLKRREQEDQTQREWFVKLKQWRLWLDGDKASAARRNILEITDKTADRPLIARLKDEKNYQVRELYLQALAGLGTPDAVKTIVKLSLVDPNEDFRLACLDQIEKHKPAAALDLYIKGPKGHEGLKSSENAEVNRAAQGLARLGNQAAVGPLIDALVTQHKFIIGSGSPGQLSPTFSRDSSGNGGAGLGVGGGGQKVIYRQMRNQEVLTALNKLTNQDFDFNINAWKYWLASTRKKDHPPVNIRRD